MKRKLGILSTVLGVLLILGAVGLAGYNLYDDWRSGNASSVALTELSDRVSLAETPARNVEQMVPATTAPQPSRFTAEPQEYIADHLLNPNMDMPVEQIDGLDYIGVLQIPALELELPIISQLTYPNLKIAPCRFSGSAYLDDMILGAHNYQRHFGQLKNLNVGDLLYFTDMDGNSFVYQVVDFEILGPYDADLLESGDWDLTLFTCTYGGQTRLTVRCQRLLEK